MAPPPFAGFPGTFRSCLSLALQRPISLQLADVSRYNTAEGLRHSWRTRLNSSPCGTRPPRCLLDAQWTLSCIRARFVLWQRQPGAFWWHAGGKAGGQEAGRAAGKAHLRGQQCCHVGYWKEGTSLTWLPLPLCRTPLLVLAPAPVQPVLGECWLNDAAAAATHAPTDWGCNHVTCRALALHIGRLAGLDQRSGFPAAARGAASPLQEFAGTDPTAAQALWSGASPGRSNSTRSAGSSSSGTQATQKPCHVGPSFGAPRLQNVSEISC